MSVDSTYVEPSISFQAFFVQAFNIVGDSWRFNMLLLYILWDDCLIFMISYSNEQLQQQLECTLLKPDCHCWWTSKMQSGRQDTLEEWYAIKFCFKLGKMPQKRMECFKLLLEHLAWIEHQFLSGIRDSRKAGSLWGKMRGVGGVRKSMHQSWLAKGLGLGLVCWGFKRIQEEIPREEASTLQIGSVHCSRRRLLRRGLEFHVCTINKSAHTKKAGNVLKVPRMKNLISASELVNK